MVQRQALRVLVVDDDPIVCEVLRERLEGLGHTVYTKESAFGVSALVSQERPSIVLLDLKMPGLSGNRLAQLDSMKNVKIILHSSTPQSELDEIAKEIGAIGGIQKTSNAALFAAKFSSLLGRAQ